MTTLLNQEANETTKRPDVLVVARIPTHVRRECLPLESRSILKLCDRSLSVSCRDKSCRPRSEKQHFFERTEPKDVGACGSRYYCCVHLSRLHLKTTNTASASQYKKGVSHQPRKVVEVTHVSPLADTSGRKQNNQFLWEERIAKRTVQANTRTNGEQ